MLQKVNFQPGFNKQVTSTGGEGQWVAGDNVRFRYGTPEKIGLVPKETKILMGNTDPMLKIELKGVEDEIV